MRRRRFYIRKDAGRFEPVSATPGVRMRSPIMLEAKPSLQLQHSTRSRARGKPKVRIADVGVRRSKLEWLQVRQVKNVIRNCPQVNAAVLRDVERLAHRRIYRAIIRPTEAVPPNDRQSRRLVEVKRAARLHLRPAAAPREINARRGERVERAAVNRRLQYAA